MPVFCSGEFLFSEYMIQETNRKPIMLYIANFDYFSLNESKRRK